MVRTNSAAHRARRRTALLAASAIALVFAAAPERAAAQFMGSGEVRAGNAEIGGNTVTVLAPRTVIDWSPSDASGPPVIDFLPSENSVFYNSSLTDYTVLNRILPSTTSMIGLNGTIASTVSDGIESQIPGGNVWFYTPYGFVVGSGATISVGGLILTTNDIQYGVDGNNGAIFTDANGAIRFAGADDSKAPIIIESGAGIVGNNASSYIAFVAPRIEQRGFVSADRSVAYVAGEAVDLTIDQGNFSIVVGQGTTDENGIVHTGITTGSQSVSSSDGKAISFVAIPKNEALTMMLGGAIGYASASSVLSDGSSIVLTAGQDGSPHGNILIGASEFNNRLNGHATGDLTVAPEPPGPFSEGASNTYFRSFTNLEGEKSVHVTAAGNTRVQADNGLTLRTGNDTAAGSVVVEAFGGGFQPGEISIASGLNLEAQHYGSTSEDGESGTDAQGGTIAVRASGGTIAADYLYASAFGQGGYGVLQGGNGTGGSIELAAGFGGTITTGSVSLYATGDGGQASGFVNDQFVVGRGGVGRGGSVTVADSLGDRTEDPNGGTLNLGFVYLSASAVGGNSSFGSGLGGDAFGGSIDLLFDRQDQAFQSIYGYAQAQDGDSAVDPIGGDITMTVGGGVSVDLSDLYLDASAVSGINGPEGAFARGGTVDLTVTEGAVLRTEFSLNLSARAETSFFFSEGLPESTADLTGGDVTMSADGGTIEAGYLYVDVGAYNYGAAERAGFAQGGTATLTAANGGSLGTRVQDNEGSPEFHVDADAYTGAGIAVGEARGGEITLSALTGGSIVAPFITIELDAAGETGIVQPEEQTNGAPAVGGTIAIDAIGGSITAPIDAYAFGEGGSADLDAGSGSGGAIDVRVLEGGALTGSLFASVYGQGGQSFATGEGGDGIGGSVSMLTDATASLPFFYLYAAAYGSGGVAADGQGGDGTGGSAQVDILGGEHDWSGAYIAAYAEGASSQGASSIAGSAFGGETASEFHVGGGASLSMSFLSLDASAIAFANGGANEAVGGTIGLTVDGGATLDTFGTSVDASATMAFEEESAFSIDTTPTVRGGTASAVADGGTIRTSDLQVVANGTTAGALTAAGSATGGNATVGAANGGLIEIIEGGGQEVIAFREFGSGLIVEAVGFGAEGPSAAHALGGTATLYTQGGTISSPYDLEVRADALAGGFAGIFDEFAIPTTGMNATGGTASVEMRAGGTGTGAITAPSLTVSAQGRADDLGSVIGNGGNGTGGTATLSVAEGALDAGFGIAVLANGYGGEADENEEGTTAFPGGDGQGGTASLVLSGGSATASRVGIEAAGYGAGGVGFNEGATPSLAGDGTGGSATFRATGGALITLGFGEGGGDFTVDGSGYGGNGAFHPDGGTGGTGGSGSGGSALFEAPAGSTADLTIGVPISVLAEGRGGEAGFSTSETPGTGGDGAGGDAAMRLGDIGFAFGSVLISGSGYGGFGGNSGVGDGGSAEFSLVDSGNAPAARWLGLLSLQAAGFEYDGVTPAGAGGTVVFNALAGSPEAGLAIEGDLIIDARGTTAPAGNGFTGSIAGAPVTVGGATTVLTPGSGVLTIADPGALAVTGDLTIDIGGSFASTGAISTLANASVTAPGGISMTDLSAGGTTLLLATGGPVTVSNSLASGGLVTVLGTSVDLRSLGALAFADADATDGDLSIETEGDLDLATVDATGAVTLISNAGTIHNTGAINGTNLTFVAGVDVISDTAIAANGNLTVDAGGVFSTPDGSASASGNVSLSADLGLNLASVVSGGTTLLQADEGQVQVDSLTSAGAVTALAQAVSIFSPGALTFANAQATAGDLHVEATGGLAVATAGATGEIALTSNGGAITGTGPIVAGGPLSARGATGVTLGTATSGGATTLMGTSGPVTVANLNSVGAVTAEGTAVDIGSSGALTFAALEATAGNVRVQTAGDLGIGAVDATGSITLVSTGGALAASGALNGVGITLSSFADLSLANALSTSGAINLTSTNGSVTAANPVTAGGNLAVSGNTGVTLGTASSGGTTTLNSTNGAVAVANLASAGAVTARGRSVAIGSAGALTFADLDATAGNVQVQTAGNLAVSTVDATGSVTLTSTGGALAVGGAINANGIALSSLANLSLASSLGTPGAISLTSTGGSVTAANPVAAGGNLAVSGSTGITLGTASSGGTTTLTASNGAVAVTNLASTGAVTASGRSVAIGSTGALTIASAQATAGNLSLATGQSLNVGSASATGTVGVSAGGNLATTGAVSGTGIALSGANVTLGGAVNSSAGLTLAAQQLLTVNAAATGSAITATAGDIAVGSAGRLGSRGLTGTLTIAATGTAAPINLGGSGTAGQFSLDSAEVARLFADQRISVVSGSGPITIGSLALSYGTAATNNIGTGGTLKVDTAGVVTVNGAVALTTSSASDTFSIDPSRIEVVAGPGSIAMLGSGGNPLGTLILEGGTIVVADQATIGAIGSAGDFAAVRGLLDQPTATQSDHGFLQAGSIDIFAADALYIQNTGTSTATTARRGFTAGAFNIDTGSSSTRIAVNGVILGSNGTLTGRQAIDFVTVNGEPAARGGSFDPFSTINGCVIGSSCSTTGAFTRSDLETPVGADDLEGTGQSTTLVQLADAEPLITPPLVDEPITGVGNDDLWQVHCDPEEDKEGCPAGQGETDE